MKEINLRDYYPFYTNDMIVSVPDEVVEVLEEYRRRDETYRIRTYRHGAFYSLDLNDGIEREIVLVQPSPFEILEQMHIKEVIYKGLSTLSTMWRHLIPYFQVSARTVSTASWQVSTPSRSASAKKGCRRSRAIRQSSMRTW